MFLVRKPMALGSHRPRQVKVWANKVKFTLNTALKACDPIPSQSFEYMSVYDVSVYEYMHLFYIVFWWPKMAEASNSTSNLNRTSPPRSSKIQAFTTEMVFRVPCGLPRGKLGKSWLNIFVRIADNSSWIAWSFALTCHPVWARLKGNMGQYGIYQCPIGWMVTRFC